MADIRQIIRRMADAITFVDPEWDVSPGTPTFKIIEAVASEIGLVYETSLLNDFHYDVDTKTGVDLEDFVALFGLFRRGGRRATGTATFQRGTPATEPIVIPVGTPVVAPPTANRFQILFNVTASVTLDIGQTAVEAPIEAAVAGTVGNIAAGAITLIAATLPGITAVVNDSALSGGGDQEADSELRERWRNTKFRSLSGTEDQYLAIVLSNVDAARAIVIGPSERVIETLEVVAGVVTPQVIDAKEFYPAGSDSVGYDFGTSVEALGVRNVDYSYSDVDGEVTILNATMFPNGDVVDYQFEYIPDCSRNSLSTNKLHKVDVFVDGTKVANADETVIIDYARVFNATVNDDLERVQWKRDDEVTSPAIGNYLIELTQTPIVSLPQTISVGGTDYELDTDFFLIHDITTDRGSVRARDGIEWVTGQAPADSSTFDLQYVYNQLIKTLDSDIEDVKQIGVDTLVHAVDEVSLRVHLVVVFTPAANPGVYVEEISSALSSLFASSDSAFRGSVKIANIIDTVNSLADVQNVRLTTSVDDAVDYGIQRIARDGSTVLNIYTSDFSMTSEQVASLESVVVDTRAQNTF